MKVAIRTTRLITTRVRHEITAEDILEFISLRVSVPKKGVKDVAITVHVPGGGDWSNTDLHIDAKTPVVVEYTTEESKTEDT